MHKPLILKKIGLSFSSKSCFEEFSTQVYPGSRIAVIGRNGTGKSSLLNVIRGALAPSSGHVILPSDLYVAYVEQTITSFGDLSGGQRLNKRLSEALAQYPDVLLLDEPTNHLDRDNRRSLMSMLRKYRGTLIIVSHDRELIRSCIDILWHIDGNKIQTFTGSYDDYIRAIHQQRVSIEKELSSVKRTLKETHQSLRRL